MKVGGLALCGKLDRYVGRMFAMSFATAILLVVGLFIVVDVATHLGFFEPGEDGRIASTWTVFQYYALSVPFLFTQASPFVTVVAAMFTVSRMVKKNEFSAGLSAGVSAQRLLASVFLGSVLAAVATFAIREVATATIGARRDALFDQLAKQRDEAVFDKKFFFRVEGGTVVQLGEFHAGIPGVKPPEAFNLEATFKQRGVIVHVAAEHIEWVADGPDPHWKVEGGTMGEVGDASTVTPLTNLGMLHFTPEDVLTQAKARIFVLQLSFQQVGRLRRNDPDNTSYQTLEQYLLTFPLANIVLVLCAVPFLVGRERGKGGEAVMGGLLLCVGFFCVDFVTRSMGLSGDLSPLMSAWLPVLLFGALGISLTHFMRT